MTLDPEALVTQFGENPHAFVWILRQDCENQHLDLSKQTKRWNDSLQDYPIDGFDHRTWTLWAITDNGDLIFHDQCKRVAIVDPRTNEYSIHMIAPAQCLEELPTLMPDVFQ